MHPSEVYLEMPLFNELCATLAYKLDEELSIVVRGAIFFIELSRYSWGNHSHAFDHQNEHLQRGPTDKVRTALRSKFHLVTDWSKGHKLLPRWRI